MNSREDILQRVRRGLRQSALPHSAPADLDLWLAAKNQGPRPRLPSAPADLLERFCREAQRQNCSLTRIRDMSAAPAAIADYLTRHNLPQQAVCWPQLASLPWSAVALQIRFGGAADTDRVGVTGCFCALAETGSLMLRSSVATPSSVSLLPETHIALLSAADIVPGMEEAWQRLRANAGDTLPRAVNFISGPSRTADIEQTVVIGAHGPYRVHLLVVE